MDILNANHCIFRDEGEAIDLDRYLQYVSSQAPTTLPPRASVTADSLQSSQRSVQDPVGSEEVKKSLGDTWGKPAPTR